jgi:dynein heavy chain
VLNTSAAYEYDNVLKFFKGVAASGSWVVFDEFNRMDTGVLAFLSQVIIQIQTALRMKMTSVNLDEAKVNLIGDCSIIITTNPGYAGRTELPVNLKNLFRTVSMAVPDSTYIAEILLYSSGFTLAERLAQKMVQVQNMANIIMQRLPHVSYDFGLRAIKSIIKIA